MRILNFFLAGCLAALAVLIYEVKYESRELELRVAELRHSVRGERDAVAVLRAEWSHLNRPERIERLARKHLGLEPLQAQQMLTLDQLAATSVPAAPGPVARKLGEDAVPVRRTPIGAAR